MMGLLDKAACAKPTAVAMQVRESTGTISWGGGISDFPEWKLTSVMCIFCKTLGQQLFFLSCWHVVSFVFCIYIYIYMNSFIKAPSNEFWVLWTGRGTSSASRQPEYLRRCHGGAEFVPCGKCHQSMVDPSLTSGAWTICNATIIILAAP